MRGVASDDAKAPGDGPIAVIRGNRLYADPELGWGGLASTIETSAIGGGRSGCVAS